MTKEEIKIIHDLRREGVPVRQIASEVGKSFQSVYNYIHKYAPNLMQRSPKGSHFPAIISWCQSNNISYAQLANLLGYKESQLRYILSRKEKLPIPLADKLCSITGLTYKELTRQPKRRSKNTTSLAIRKAMNENMDTVATLANKLDLPYTTVYEALQMPERHKKTIREINTHYDIGQDNCNSGERAKL